MHQVVENRSVEDGGGVELFAGYRRADDSEDARANDGTDAERRKRDGPEGLFQARLGVLRLSNELVDGFAAKNLRRQSPTPLMVD